MIASKMTRYGAWTLATGAVLGGLYLTSLHSYLLFHSISELFSIGVAIAIFLIAWNCRKFTNENYLSFIGLSFLFVGSLDLLHTLAYRGMGVFVGFDSDLATQLWIAARYLHSVSFMLAALFIHRRLRHGLMVGAYAVVTGLLLASIFGGVFPDCYVEGLGLTPFKRISELVIIGFFALSLGLLVQRREHFSRSIWRLLAGGLVLSILSEAAFTLYVDVFGLFNLIGHFLKIAAFFLVYKALVESQLINPYSTLFRSLHQKEQRLRDEWKRTEAILNAIPDGIYIVSPEYEVEYVNPAMERMFGPIEGRSCYAYLLDRQDPCEDCQFSKVLGGEVVRRHYQNARNGRIYDTVDAPFVNIRTGQTCKLKIVRDMTEIHAANEKIRSVARFPSENPYPVLRIGSDGKLLYANHASRKLMEMWGRQVNELIPEAWFALVHRAIETGEVVMHEAQVNGSVISFALIPLAEGGYVNLYGRDITEYRKAQQALREANEMLEERVAQRTEQLYQTVEALQEEVAERIETEKELVENQKRLRTLSMELIYAEERERREIATQLHDSIGPLLSFAKRELGILNRQIPSTLKEPMQYVSDMIRKAIEQTRTLTFDLSSSTLYVLGFEAAVEELAEEFAEKERFECHVNNGAEVDGLDQQVQILLYRSVRELFINIVKHSRAKNVWLDMRRSDGNLQITVKDDGVGFDPEKMGQQERLKGFGLFSLQERLVNLGGGMEIRSAVGEGTTVTLSAPINPDAADA